MASHQVYIEIEARFQDNVSTGAKHASTVIEDLGEAADKSKKKVSDLGKTKSKPTLDADDSKLLKKLRTAEEKANKLGRKKTSMVLHAMDKATTVIGKVLSKAKNFAGKTFRGALTVADKATSLIEGAWNKGRKFAGKTWSAIVKIKDYATAPLTKLKNMLFSIKSLVMAITAGLAAKQLVVNPVSLADTYTSSQIAFSTLLGETAGQEMMDDIDEFAKATPFKTSGVTENASKMLAYGWQSDRIIEDLETIGDAAAATGKGDEGLESIVYALSEIRSKGKLSTAELNQLASAGIKAKAYLAEGLGYGTDDKGLAKLAEDLEDGAIGANQAIELILEGMKEFDGMMEKTANETVSGLWGQIEDTFEINIFRKWGQGLQDGAKKGLGTVVDLLDSADAALSKFGDLVYDVGKAISNWAADKLAKMVERLTEITGSYEWSEATLGGKIKLLWDGLVADPLKEWWENGGQEKTAETAGKIGAWLGKTLSSVIKGMLGITDILTDDTLTESGAAGVAQSFASAFVDNFDVSGITDKLVEAISNVWNALPTWAKWTLGIYAGGKALGGIASFVGGIASFVGGTGAAIGSASAGTGLLGYGANTAIALGAGNLAGGASLSAGALSALGLGATAGGVAGAYAAGKGIWDLYGSYKAYKAGDTTEYQAKSASGGLALTGVATGAATGAAIGSVIPGLGTAVGALIGAGVGGIAGLWGGSKLAEQIRTDAEAAKYETQEMQEAIKDTDKTAEELADTFNEVVWNGMRDQFGDIELSMEEISRLAEQITMGDATAGMEKFQSATTKAEASLQTLQAASEDTGRWMWKASLGVKFDADEIKSIQASFDDYIASAKSYVEDKHYEFTAAVSLLVDVTSEEGKSILASGDAYYTKIQDQLDKLGDELSDTVEIALKDGVITLDEQAEITNLQQQIADIMEKLANAQADAELETIKIKFGGESNITFDSFQNLQSVLQTTVDDQIANYDDALTASIASLNLQLEDGAITKEEYEQQLQTLMDGYEAKVEGLKAKATNAQIEIVAGSYENILGEDGVADIQHALQEAIDTGIDPIEWSDEKLAKLLGVDQLGPEKAQELRLILQSILEGGIPDHVEKVVGVDISAEPEITNKIEVVKEDFGVEDQYAETVAMLLYGDKDILNQIDVSQLAKEFGIPEEQAKTIIEKLKGTKSIENRVEVLTSDFGIPDVLYKTVKIKLSGSVSTTGNIQSSYASKQYQLLYGNSARGDIWYPPGMHAKGFADGGMVRGGGRLIRVAEEGSPEMIIPLSSQRRERGLKLWAKAGEMMKVPGFARGGSTSGSQDEGLRFQRYEDSEGAGGQSVQVDVGGVTVEIHVDANGQESIAEAIKAQASEIAETVAGYMADALGAKFENTPARGGA